jgi:hypothetical protein
VGVSLPLPEVGASSNPAFRCVARALPKVPGHGHRPHPEGDSAPIGEMSNRRNRLRQRLSHVVLSPVVLQCCRQARNAYLTSSLRPRDRGRDAASP